MRRVSLLWLLFGFARDKNTITPTLLVSTARSARRRAGALRVEALHPNPPLPSPSLPGCHSDRGKRRGKERGALTRTAADENISNRIRSVGSI